MRQRRIDQGNAQDVIERGRDVIIVPDEVNETSTVTRERVIRGQGLDVIHGREWANPDNIPVTDDAYPGWRCKGTIPGEEIAITNNLSGNWSSAYLVMGVTLSLTGYGTFDVTVTRAELKTPSGADIAVFPEWSRDTTSSPNGELLVAEGLYLIPVAKKVGGRPFMLNFHQFSSWLDEYNDPAWQESHYYASLSSTGLGGNGHGYTINVLPGGGASWVGRNLFYMNGVPEDTFDALVRFTY